MALIEDFEKRFLLGVPAMDRNHREFVELINRMAEATNPVFAYLFPEMVQHTHAHFAAEEAMMREIVFNGVEEHRNMHARVLGEMDWFGKAYSERSFDSGTNLFARAASDLVRRAHPHHG